MIPLAVGYGLNKETLPLYLKQLALKAVDGTVDNAIKHKTANSSDSSAISNTSALTNFSTNYVLSANQFYVGRIFKFIASGVYSTTGTPTLTFQFRLGTTNLVIFAAKTGINNAANQSWKIEGDIVVRATGASGTVLSHGTLFINTASGTDTVETVVNNSTVTVNTTADNTLQVALTWSAASASNTATLKNFILMLSDY